MAKLTARQRAKLRPSQYAIPEREEYPIPDEKHARMALSEVDKDGSPEDKAKVRAAVKKKFPDIDPDDPGDKPDDTKARDRASKDKQKGGGLGSMSASDKARAADRRKRGVL